MHILKGKYEMNDIYQTLTKFSSGAVALLGDIRKMFWQIKINDKDQIYHGVIYKGNTYVFTSNLSSKSKRLTKRKVLSRIAEVWDPLGICARVLLTGKKLFQAVVPVTNTKLCSKWNDWLHEILKCDDNCLFYFAFPWIPIYAP